MSKSTPQGFFKYGTPIHGGSKIIPRKAVPSSEYNKGQLKGLYHGKVPIPKAGVQPLPFKGADDYNYVAESSYLNEPVPADLYNLNSLPGLNNAKTPVPRVWTEQRALEIFKQEDGEDIMTKTQEEIPKMDLMKTLKTLLKSSVNPLDQDLWSDLISRLARLRASATDSKPVDEAGLRELESIREATRIAVSQPRRGRGVIPPFPGPPAAAVAFPGLPASVQQSMRLPNVIKVGDWDNMLKNEKTDYKQAVFANAKKMGRILPNKPQFNDGTDLVITNPFGPPVSKNLFSFRTVRDWIDNSNRTKKYQINISTLKVELSS